MVKAIKVYEDDKIVVYDYYSEAKMDKEPGRFEYDLKTGNYKSLKYADGEDEYFRYYCGKVLARIDKCISNNEPLPNEFTICWY